MSHENVEVTKQALDALNRRDVDGLMEWVTGDFEFNSAMGGAVLGGRLSGRKGIEELVKDIGDTWAGSATGR
jgi:hypothetical protein